MCNSKFAMPEANEAQGRFITEKKACEVSSSHPADRPFCLRRGDYLDGLA